MTIGKTIGGLFGTLVAVDLTEKIVKKTSDLMDLDEELKDLDID